MENYGTFKISIHKLSCGSLYVQDMEVTKWQLEIIIRYAKDTEVEQLKS